MEDKDGELVSQNFMLTILGEYRWIPHDVLRRNKLEGNLHRIFLNQLKPKYEWEGQSGKCIPNFYLRIYRSKNQK